MKLEEAIKHLEEKIIEIDCIECKNEHEQLLQWLKELKLYKNLDILSYRQTIQAFAADFDLAVESPQRINDLKILLEKGNPYLLKSINNLSKLEYMLRELKIDLENLGIEMEQWTEH